MIKELNYDLTKKDYINFTSFHRFKHNKGWIIRLLIFSLIIAIICYFINANIITYMTAYILFIILILSGPYIFALRIENIKASIKIDNNKNTLFVSLYTVNEFNWCNIKKIRNSKHYFFIYASNNFAIIIPKRIFESEQEMNETWELIQECYNKNREDIR